MYCEGPSRSVRAEELSWSWRLLIRRMNNNGLLEQKLSPKESPPKLLNFPMALRILHCPENMTVIGRVRWLE